jgi:tetratricopeptide (TPR) repeat protein
LYSAGRAEEAITVLKENLSRHPDDRDTLLALVNYSRETGDLRSALEYAEQAAHVLPGDPNLTTLIEDLRHQTKK